MTSNRVEIPKQDQQLGSGCGLFDRSDRGKLALTGTDAKEFLNGQVTNDVLVLEPGTGCYAAFLTSKGKMLGDLRILNTGEELLLDTERVALQILFDTIRRTNIGFDVQLHKRTLERGMLSLIGPRTRSVIGNGVHLPETEHANQPISLGGVTCLAVATWAGIDLICPSALTEQLADYLTKQEGVQPLSEQTVESLRIEKGIPRYGIDMDATTIPQEAGLNERAVSFTKGCYTGQETVARLYYKGRPNRHLRGVKLSEPTTVGTELLHGDKPVGKLTSFTLSQAFGPIGLALVRREVQPGQVVTLPPGNTTGEIVELPFSG